MTFYWIGGGGNYWHNHNSTGPWSLTSGGLPYDTACPTAADNVIFDENSALISNTVLSNADMECNSITFNELVSDMIIPLVSYNLKVAGDLILGPHIKFGYNVPDYTHSIQLKATSAGFLIDFNGFNQGGLYVPNIIFDGVGGGWTVQSDIALPGREITLLAGSLNLNGKTINCSSFLLGTSGVRTLTMGASVVNCSTQFGVSATYTNLTLTEGTSTINTGAFIANGETYYDVNATNYIYGPGTFHNAVLTNSTEGIINESNTFNDLTINAPIITLAAGKTQTILGELYPKVGSATSHTQVKSGFATSTATISKASGQINFNFATIQDITVSGGALGYASNSTNTSNNSGIDFTLNPANIFDLDGYETPFSSADGTITIAISKDGGATFTADKTKIFGANAETIQFGGKADVWGTTWVGADLTDAKFMIAVYGDTVGEIMYLSNFGFDSAPYSLDPAIVISGIIVDVRARYESGKVYIDAVQPRLNAGNPSLTVKNGAVAYASNGRKPGEGAGDGTGIVVYLGKDGLWKSVADGTTIAA